MAARLAGIPSVVRLTGTNEVDIRKALEMGVEGVVILDGKVPHATWLDLYTDHGAGTLIRRG